jgi:hypothetical protein
MWRVQSFEHIIKINFLAHKKRKSQGGHSSSAAKLRVLLTVSLIGEKLKSPATWDKKRKQRHHPGKWIIYKRAWITSDISEEYLSSSTVRSLRHPSATLKENTSQTYP